MHLPRALTIHDWPRPLVRAAGVIAACCAALGAPACRNASGPEALMSGRYLLGSVAGEPVPTVSAPDGIYRVRNGEMVFGPADRVVRRVWYEPADPASGNPLLLRIHEGTFALAPGGVLKLELVDPVAATLFTWQTHATLEEPSPGSRPSLLLNAGRAQDGSTLLERYVPAPRLP